MKTITRTPSSIPLAPVAQKDVSEAAAHSPALKTHAGEAHAGLGALQGHQISVGTSDAAPQPGAATAMPHGVQKAAQDVQLHTPQTPTARQAALERPAARAQPSNSTAALYVARPGGLATNAAVLKALHAHAQAAGTVLTPKEIAGYVALGEHAVHALQQPSTALDRRLGETFVNTVNPPVVLRPNMEATRGISWYVAACAAQQDLNQLSSHGAAATVNGKEVTSLTTKGACIFKDPGNAVYNFMQSSPLTYARTSTHFNERSASSGMIGSRPEQRGVEDYDRRLPGQNGAVLFDKLKGGEMFIKFERTGFPDVSTSSRRVDDQGKGGASVWQALQRSLGNARDYVMSRFAGAQGVDRKEHVVKGLLQSPVQEPFMQVVKTAEKLGLATGMSPAAHEKQSKKLGLPHLEATLAQIKQTIGQLEQQPSTQQLELLHDVIQVQAAITMAKAELGAQSDHLGIERRGAETHIDLKPPQSHLKEAHKEFMRPGGTLELAQGVLQSYTPAVEGTHTIPAGVNFTAVKDWNRNGITINGNLYPGQAREGNVSSSEQGRPSTLEQASKAFVQACGNNPVAAEWISRFAQQGMAKPLLDYLAQESLGTVGDGMLVASGVQTFEVNALSNGSVELRMDYRYQNSEANPIPLTSTVDVMKEPLDMDAQASLHATVTLRFENLTSFTATQVPVPVISAPLTYTTSHFDAA